MRTTGREYVGECTPEFLFASSKYPVSVVLKPVAAAASGVLKRGTALALKDGKCVILGTEGATAAYVLAEDVDSAEEVIAEVFRTGHFIKNGLIVAEGYEITDSDVEEFRKAGIILDNGIVE